jgi:hypothetical protein
VPGLDQGRKTRVNTLLHAFMRCATRCAFPEIVVFLEV